MKLTPSVIAEADVIIEVESPEEAERAFRGFLHNTVPAHLRVNGFYTYTREHGERVLVRLKPKAVEQAMGPT